MAEKLLFLDLDGTVIWPGSFEMPESTERAIAKARANGHKAIICTGRNMGAIRPVLKYGFDGIIASAGGVIQLGDEVLSDTPMPEDETKEAIRVLRENGVAITVETYDYMFLDEKIYEIVGRAASSTENSELVRLRKQSDEQLHCRPLSEYRGEPVYKILLLWEEESQIEVPEKVLGDRYFFVKHVRDENGLLNGELINRRVGKGKALRQVTEYLQKDIADTIGLGDSMNDYELIAAAGYSVCMGNGPEALKKLSDYVCPDQADDGLAEAFLKLGLI
ncbi:MAG: HAD family hydrolase [Clostridiales bacterium]|nr:HAD family hydrolase [Candidatus Blautia equi]